MSTDMDEWMRTHKGPLVRTVGHVWWCGDYVCDCSQAQITDYFRNLVVPRAFVPITTWEGTFFTDGESGARAELVAKRLEMPESESSRIEWVGIDTATSVGATSEQTTSLQDDTLGPLPIADG